MSAVLGAVIGGGRSERYGEPKALARVGGRRIIDRVRGCLHEVVDDIVLIANDAELAASVGLEWRPDALSGGALAGLFTALQWSRERGCHGVLAIACDMPFVSPALLRHVLERAALADEPDVVAPASDGPRGLEPLCAYYGDACLEAIERALGRGDRRLIGFHEHVRVALVPFDEVAVFGRPEVLFLNINTPADRAAAERLVLEGSV